MLEPQAIEYIDNDATIWEDSPLKTLASTKQLGAYRHDGFWMPMDTLRDKNELEDLWLAGRAPWKLWT